MSPLLASMLILTWSEYLDDVLAHVFLVHVQLCVRVLCLDELQQKVAQNVEVGVIVMGFGQAVVELLLDGTVVEKRLIPGLRLLDPVFVEHVRQVETFEKVSEVLRNFEPESFFVNLLKLFLGTKGKANCSGKKI